MPTTATSQPSDVLEYLTGTPQTVKALAAAASLSTTKVQAMLEALAPENVVVRVELGSVTAYRRPTTLEEFTRAVSNRPTEERVRVTMTYPAAHFVVSALDLFTRMGIGQLTEISSMARWEQLRNSAGNPVDDNRIQRMESLLQDAKSSVLGFAAGASLGIHHPKVNPVVLRCYQVQRGLRHRMAWDADARTTHSTWHQEPSFSGADSVLVLTVDGPTPGTKALLLELSTEDARAVELALNFYAQVLQGNLDALLELGHKEILITKEGLPLSEEQLQMLGDICKHAASALRPGVLETVRSTVAPVAPAMHALASSLHSVVAKLSQSVQLGVNTELAMAVELTSSNKFSPSLDEVPASVMLSFKKNRYRVIGPSQLGKGMAILAEAFQIQTAIAKARGFAPKF